MIITEHFTVREKTDIPKNSYRDWIRRRFCFPPKVLQRLDKTTFLLSPKTPTEIG